MTIKSFYVIIAGLVLAGVSIADTTEQQTLYSPVTGQLFSKLGNGMLIGQPEEVDVAMTFLQAGILLDEQSASGYEQFLRGVGKARGSRQNYSETILLSLRRYLDRKADLDIAADALASVLDNANSRQEREVILRKLMNQIAESNPVFGSDVATQLGLYAVEKADYAEAIKYFEAACRLNPYNLLAGGKVLELYTQQTPAIAMSEKLNYLRLRLTVDPLNMVAAIEFGRVAYQAGLYDFAADAFGYAETLSGWLQPGSVPSDEIVVGLAESCYYVPSRWSQCLTIADEVRKSGRFNLAVESVAVLAARKMAKKDSREATFEKIALQAEQVLLTGSTDVTPMEVGWFYCFVSEIPDKALAWCNRAFTENPDMPGVKTLLAYAFLLNDQGEMARQYIENAAEGDAVAMLVEARLALEDQQKQKAAEFLKKILSLMVPPPIRDKAAAMIKENGIEIISDTSIDVIRKSLTDAFGKSVIPAFVSPDKVFSVRLNFNGTEFAYSNSIEGDLVITNTGSMPLVIGSEGLLTGRYQVAVVVTGDMNFKIPCLLKGAFRPARPIQPGESVSVRLGVNVGQLEQFLFMCPQAAMEIKFTVYLDPMQSEEGTIANGIQGLLPVETTIRRKAVTLTREFLVQSLDALSKGQEGLRIRTAELFAGLYAEQQAYKAGTISYRHSQVESMLLNDAVRRALLDENWKVRVQALMLLARYSIALDYPMTLSVSENISHENWPVRMAAMWLLASQQKATFQSVLDWSTQNDPFWLNRQLAASLGGSLPKTDSEKKESQSITPAL